MDTQFSIEQAIVMGLMINRIFVAVTGTTSSEALFRSGIPQRSVLGPLLILIHNCDINNKIMDLKNIILCWWYSNPSGTTKRGHTDVTKWFTKLCKLADANDANLQQQMQTQICNNQQIIWWFKYWCQRKRQRSKNDQHSHFHSSF